MRGFLRKTPCFARKIIPQGRFPRGGCIANTGDGRKGWRIAVIPRGRDFQRAGG
ncbi:MAG: hypothetical protein ACXIT4_05680 [Erythrobacter sp.]